MTTKPITSDKLLLTLAAVNEKLKVTNERVRELCELLKQLMQLLKPIFTIVLLVGGLVHAFRVKLGPGI